MFTRYPESYALVDDERKKTKFKLRKSYKNYLRIKAKCHAHLQTVTKAPVKFDKNPNKIVGKVAFTRLATICDRQSDGQTADGHMDAQRKTVRHPTPKRMNTSPYPNREDIIVI